MNLTPKAKQLWDTIPGEFQVKLLNNVYCVNCRKSRGIKVEKGFVEDGDLILKGTCTTCNYEVARLIESS